MPKYLLNVNFLLVQKTKTLTNLCIKFNKSKIVIENVNTNNKSSLSELKFKANAEYENNAQSLRQKTTRCA